MLRGTIPLVAVLAAALFDSGGVASAETLRIGGVGAATNLLPKLFASFDGVQRSKLDVIPSLGSSGGLRALADGALDVAVSGRPLTPEESAQGLTPAVAVRTPFVLVTSKLHPNGFDGSQLAAIYRSAKPTWADGTPIRIILRPKSDSDTAVLGSMFPGMAAAIEDARRRPDIPTAATDQDNADLVERVPGSLATSTLTQIEVEGRNLRFVAIDGAEPSLEHLEQGRYPFAKTLYFVLPARPTPLAEHFISFLASPTGQAVLRANGNIPVGNRDQR
jgi:phosphate transport system substrate-binding protein